MRSGALNITIDKWEFHTSCELCADAHSLQSSFLPWLDLSLAPSFTSSPHPWGTLSIDLSLGSRPGLNEASAQARLTLPGLARPLPLLTGSRWLAHYSRPYTHNLTSWQGPFSAHLVTLGLARGLRTPSPLSFCLLHTSRTRLPPGCPALRASALAPWPRFTGRPTLSAQAHRLGHDSGSRPGPAHPRPGQDCPPPSPLPPLLFVCLSSISCARASFSSLAALHSVACLTVFSSPVFTVYGRALS